MAIILFAISAAYNAFALAYIIRRAKMRKRSPKGGFAVYGEHFDSAMLGLIAAAAFCALLGVAAFTAEYPGDGAAAFAFLISLLPMLPALNRYSRGAVYDGSLLKFRQGLFSPVREVRLTSIDSIRFKGAKMLLYAGENRVLSLPVYYRNARKLQTLILGGGAHTLFAAMGGFYKLPDEFTVRMKPFTAAAAFALFSALSAGGVLIAVYSSEAKALGIILAALFLCLSPLFVLAAARYRITVTSQDITFTPLFGKTRVYRREWLESVIICCIHHRIGYSYNISLCFSNGKSISGIPLGYACTPELLAAFRHLVTEA